MFQKIAIPVLILIAIALGVFFYSDYNDKVEEKIKIEKERLAEEKDRKERLEIEISELQNDITDSKTKIENLNAKITSLNTQVTEVKASKSKTQKSLNRYSYLLKKERNKIADSKNKIVALINKHLAGLLDHRVRKLSIFNDDSSFAYYTGRRNYISLDKQNNFKMERTIHFTTTGQYLQAIYQDKDNGNNRFLISTYDVPFDNLNLKSAEIKDLSKKEKLDIGKNLREETYVNIEVPIKNSASLINLVKTVEYEKEQFQNKSKEKSIDFYTTSVEQAEEVLALFKVLSTLI